MKLWRRLPPRMHVLAMEALLLTRGLLLYGGRFECPCCGWRFRHFVMGGGSFRRREDGYCPRCNSKARHRRVWLYLQEDPRLLQPPLRLLHVSPRYCLGRRLSRMRGIDYVGLDLSRGPFVTVAGDLTHLPFDDCSFDAVLCVHVLEHIEADDRALANLFRVLRPGGWALINVPLREGKPTYEDPSIRSPRERQRAFGEETHVRIYGDDLGDRLGSAGFDYSLERAPKWFGRTSRMGLPSDEHVFLCRRPRAEVGV
ncbi:MAG: class I SAM-dependent methyltransferase [Acidimicrobiia bacterium]